MGGDGTKEIAKNLFVRAPAVGTIDNHVIVAGTLDRKDFGNLSSINTMFFQAEFHAAVITRHLEERRALQERLDHLHTIQQEDLFRLKEALFSNMPEEKTEQFKPHFESPVFDHQKHFDLEM